MSFFGVTGTPCSGFLVMSPLGFKAKEGSALFAFHRGKCNIHSPSTCGATHADLLVAGIAASPVATYCCRGEVARIRTHALRVWRSTNWAKPGPTTGASYILSLKHDLSLGRLILWWAWLAMRYTLSWTSYTSPCNSAIISWDCVRDQGISPVMDPSRMKWMFSEWVMTATAWPCSFHPLFNFYSIPFQPFCWILHVSQQLLAQGQPVHSVRPRTFRF